MFPNCTLLLGIIIELDSKCLESSVHVSSIVVLILLPALVREQIDFFVGLLDLGLSPLLRPSPNKGLIVVFKIKILNGKHS